VEGCLLRAVPMRHGDRTAAASQCRASSHSSRTAKTIKSEGAVRTLRQTAFAMSGRGCAGTIRKPGTSLRCHYLDADRASGCAPEALHDPLERRGDIRDFEIDAVGSQRAQLYSPLDHQRWLKEMTIQPPGLVTAAVISNAKAVTPLHSAYCLRLTFRAVPLRPDSQ
jgi:hypothetical protein